MNGRTASDTRSDAQGRARLNPLSLRRLDPAARADDVGELGRAAGRKEPRLDVKVEDVRQQEARQGQHHQRDDGPS